MDMEAFFELFHAGLPRLGPGSEADTARALSLVPFLPQSPLVLDIGCGNGAQTLALARLLPAARIIAVDLYPQFLSELSRRARQQGLHGRIQPVRGDMGSLCFRPRTFDLIWSEGASYTIGFAAALRAWRVLLKPGGTVALSDIAWFRDDAPEEARRFWDMEFPGMEDEDAHVRHVAECGYTLVDSFRLPPQSWWTDFYAPLSEELARFRARHSGKPEWLAVADMAQREMDVHRCHHDFYGYGFFVCRNTE